MLIPYSTEVLITRWPIANIVIIAMCVVTSVFLFVGAFSMSLLEAMVLHGWSPLGLLGHMLLHGGVLHLVFNMLFLWVFGNAVCETTGNLKYFVLFLTLGLLAAAIHNVLDGAPAIGASGAINGIIGFYLVLYPINRVSCLYWFFVRGGVFDISGYWLIIFWFIMDAWGALSGGDAGIAYWAHVGGLLAGVSLGALYEVKGWAALQEYDNPSLIDILFRKKKSAPIARRRRTRSEIIREYHERQVAEQQAASATRAPSSVSATCPHCNQALDIPIDLLGQTVACPACAGTIGLEEEAQP